MSDLPPMPDFPSRRSLHGAGAAPDAVERAVADLQRHEAESIPEVPIPHHAQSISRSSVVSGQSDPRAGVWKRTEKPSPLRTNSQEKEPATDQAAAPPRRSLRDRFAEVAGQADNGHNGNPSDPQSNVTPLLGIPVGAGRVSVPGDSFTHGLTGAYSIITEGVFDEALTNTGLVPVVDVLSEGEPLDSQKAVDHHLFAVPQDVDSEEIEALAVSIWDDAAWAMPGCLRLVGEAYLRGPWRMEEEQRRSLGFAEHLTYAWIVETPRLRAPSRVEPGESVFGGSSSSDSAALVNDPWARAFPKGVPLGVEYKALLALVRMARRLGGALRISGSGVIMSPVPESAVNMAVYAPRWVSPDDMQAVLSSRYEGVIDSREITAQDVAQPSPQEVRRIALVMAATKPLDPDVAEVLKKAREEASRNPQRVDGYALVIPSNGVAQIMVEVHRVMRPPRVLRWESWTNGTIIEYRVRWIPAPGGQPVLSMMDPDPNPLVVEECAQAARVIEEVAVLVAQTTGGTIVDDDGFLVGIDD